MTASSASIAAPRSSLRHLLATVGFVLVVIGLAAASAWTVNDLVERNAAVATAQERLAQIEGRARPGPAAEATDAQLVGSPFLEGQTITVAGAALQQRIGSAVAKVGGSVLSSQIGLDGPGAKAGFVSLTANLEILQPALQSLLYDLEAGMPYLFVDTLAVQAPQAFGEAEGSRMRVTLGVSGQWQPAR